MGYPVTGKRKYMLKFLSDRHKEICRRLVLGEKHKDIAADLGITRELVSIVKGSDVGQDYLQELERQRVCTVTENGTYWVGLLSYRLASSGRVLGLA